MADDVPGGRITVESLGRGRFQVVRGGSRTLAYAARAGGETWVFVGGRVYVIGAAQESRRGPGVRQDAAALGAPMPATVVSIHVREGQAVTAGDALVTLEAMKMELAVTAPHDGTVRAVRCQVGDLVQPGAPLVDLDERNAPPPTPNSQNR